MADLDAVVVKGQGLEATGPAVNRVGFSQLATVWRTLWLEVDRMDRVQNNFTNATVSASLVLGSQQFLFISPSQPSDAETPSRIFVPGRGFAAVAGAAGPILTVKLTSKIPVGTTIALLDDDDSNQNGDGTADNGTLSVTSGRITNCSGSICNGEEIAAPTTDLLETALQSAYIVPRTIDEGIGSGLNARPISPFVQNLLVDGEPFSAITPAFDTRGAADADCWLIYVLVGYQSAVDVDGDHVQFIGPSFLGLRRHTFTSGKSTTQKGIPHASFLFPEVAADGKRTAARKGTPAPPRYGDFDVLLAHEVAHHFYGPDHPKDAGLMADDDRVASFREGYPAIVIRAFREGFFNAH